MTKSSRHKLLQVAKFIAPLTVLGISVTIAMLAKGRAPRPQTLLGVVHPDKKEN